MTFMYGRSRITAALMLSTILVGASTVCGQSQTAQNQAAAGARAGETEGATADNQQKAGRQLQIFTLKHCLPTEMQAILALQASHAAQHAQIQARDRAEAAARQQQSGKEAQAAGNQVTESAQQTVEAPVSVAQDPERRLLFVRGTERQLKQISQLVQSLDVEEAQLKQQDLEDIRIFPLRASASANQTQGVLNQLQLPAQFVQRGKAGLIVVHKHSAEANAVEQIAKVVEAMDKASADEAKTTDAAQASN